MKNKKNEVYKLFSKINHKTKKLNTQIIISKTFYFIKY